MRKNVIFISQVKEPDYKDFSSTQIMTDNLIYGLREASSRLCLVALIDSNCDADKIIRYYEPIVDRVFIFHSHLDMSIHWNKYSQLMRVAYSVLLSKQYDKDVKPICEELDNADVLVSHAPYIESVPICTRLLKHKRIRYIQYWSDPYTMAGIFPEKITGKRKPHYLLEKRMLKAADEIVYGTRTLMEFQRMILPEFRDKMRYVDVSYCNTADYVPDSSREQMTYVYAGDYFTYTRNLEPLYQAFNAQNSAKLKIIGNGDLSFTDTEQVSVLPRQPHEAANAEENKADVIVCVMNHSCIQIPGKTFYRVNTAQRILVILDGKYADRIRDYLEEFGRFEFCYNNKESILKAIENMQKPDLTNPVDVEKLSPRRVAEALLGWK